MARPNPESLLFGFSSIRVEDRTGVIGHSDILGNIALPEYPELIKTSGGAAAYPVASRRGRSEGDGTITTRERPAWMDHIMGDAIITRSAAAARSASPMEAIGGGTSLTDAASACAVNLLQSGYVTGLMRVEVEATGTDKAKVRVSGTHGAQDFEVDVPEGPTVGAWTAGGGATILAGVTLTVPDANIGRFTEELEVEVTATGNAAVSIVVTRNGVAGDPIAVDGLGGAKNVPGEYFQIAKTNANLTKDEVATLRITPSWVTVGNFGFQLMKAGGDWTEGHKANFQITPETSGKISLAIPQIQEGREYTLFAYSAVGSTADSIVELIAPRVVFSGMGGALNDVAPEGDIEVKMTFLAPLDGSRIYERNYYPKVGA